MAKIRLIKEEREKRDSIIQAQMDFNSNIAYVSREATEKGKIIGKIEGKKEGEHKKALEIARGMKTMGFPTSDIMKLTKLTMKEIEAIH